MVAIATPAVVSEVLRVFCVGAVTRARFDAVEQQAIAKGIYKGVTFHRFAGAASDPNDLYDTTFRLFTPQSPFLRGKTQRAID